MGTIIYEIISEKNQSLDVNINNPVNEYGNEGKNTNTVLLKEPVK